MVMLCAPAVLGGYFWGSWLFMRSWGYLLKSGPSASTASPPTSILLPPDGLSNKTFLRGGYPLHIYNKVSLSKCKYLYGEFGLWGFHTLKTASVIRLSWIHFTLCVSPLPPTFWNSMGGKNSHCATMTACLECAVIPFFVFKEDLARVLPCTRSNLRVCSSGRMRVMIHTHQAQTQWAFSEGLEGFESGLN